MRWCFFCKAFKVSHATKVLRLPAGSAAQPDSSFQLQLIVAGASLNAHLSNPFQLGLCASKQTRLIVQFDLDRSKTLHVGSGPRLSF